MLKVGREVGEGLQRWRRAQGLWQWRHEGLFESFSRCPEMKWDEFLFVLRLNFLEVESLARVHFTEFAVLPFLMKWHNVKNDSDTEFRYARVNRVVYIVWSKSILHEQESRLGARWRDDGNELVNRGDRDSECLKFFECMFTEEFAKQETTQSERAGWSRVWWILNLSGNEIVECVLDLQEWISDES